MVVPGRYSVEMHKRVDGVVSDLGQTQSFNVVSIRPDPVLPGSTQQQRVIFESQVDELIRATSGSVKAIDAVVAELDAVKETLDRTMTDGSLYELANSIQKRIKAARDKLTGNEARGFYNDPAIMTVQARLSHARFRPSSAAYGPTATQQESLRSARALYDETVAELKTLGAHNMNQNRPAGLTSRRALQGMLQAYETWRDNGVLPATYEVIFGEVEKT